MCISRSQHGSQVGERPSTSGDHVEGPWRPIKESGELIGDDLVCDIRKLPGLVERSGLWRHGENHLENTGNRENGRELSAHVATRPQVNCRAKVQIDDLSESLDRKTPITTVGGHELAGLDQQFIRRHEVNADESVFFQVRHE